MAPATSIPTPVHSRPAMHSQNPVNPCRDLIEKEIRCVLESSFKTSDHRVRKTQADVSRIMRSFETTGSYQSKPGNGKAKSWWDRQESHRGSIPPVRSSINAPVTGHRETRSAVSHLIVLHRSLPVTRSIHVLVRPAPYSSPKIRVFSRGTDATQSARFYNRIETRRLNTPPERGNQG